MKPAPAKPIKAIIFDFDGTIADSFDVFLEVMQVITRQRHTLTPEAIEDLRKSSIKEVIKKVGIKPWQVPFLIVKGRREIGTRMGKVHAFAGMPQAIKQLAQNYSIYIVSTNSAQNITDFLERYQLNNYVTRIYGNAGLMGKAKSLKKLQRHEGLHVSECLYVGDEVRDIEASQKISMRCIAVAWGYSDPKTLQSYNPDALANTPDSLLQIVKSMSTKNNKS